MSENVDVAMIEQLKDLLGERFSELVDRFVEDGQQRVNLLQSAVPVRNFDTINAEAHGLKGSSRNVGANALGELCAILEDRGRAAEEKDIETVFAAIEKEFAAVCDSLKSFL